MAGFGKEANMSNAVELYLDLMKKSLVNSIYGDAERVPAKPRNAVFRTLMKACEKRGMQIVEPKVFDIEIRSEGLDWPPFAHTMIGLKRLDNLQSCVERVLADNVPGDLIETGVWRGGAAIFMRAILKVYAVTDRCVWVADSFEGLPSPSADKYPADRDLRLHELTELAVSLEQVRTNFERYGLADDQVRFLKGWFRDTLPNVDIQKLAVVRLDGDMYESTMDALNNLYPKLSAGGFLIVDDYGAVPACRSAIQDFRKAHGITEEIHHIDWTGIYWRRSG